MCKKASQKNKYISIVSQMRTKKKSPSFYSIEDYRKPLYLNNKIFKSLTSKPDKFSTALFKSLRFFLKNTPLLPGKINKFPERVIFPKHLNVNKPYLFEVLDTERILVLVDYLHFFSLDLALPENIKVFYNSPFKKKNKFYFFFYSKSFFTLSGTQSRKKRLKSYYLFY